jgi:exopolyphosphatase
LEKLLNHTSISCSHLITLDDLSTPGISLEKVLVPERTRWILVDHNYMTGALGSIYRDSVVGVVDHHDDEHKVPRDCGQEPRIIEKSGSCASLVSNHLSQSWNSLPLPQDEATGKPTECDAFVAKMAMASILIDTTNMTVSSKVTPHDTEAMTYLAAKVPGFKQDEFFEEISRAKEDIDKMSLVDILRKDYKEFEGVGLKLGIAGVIKPMIFLVDKAEDEKAGGDATDAFCKVLDEFAKQRSLDVVAVMTTYTPTTGDFSRELLVWGLNEAAREAVGRFERASSQELGLQEIRDKRLNFVDEDVKVWRQEAVQHSRKQVAPLLRKALI